MPQTLTKGDIWYQGEGDLQRLQLFRKELCVMKDRWMAIISEIDPEEEVVPYNDAMCGLQQSEEFLQNTIIETEQNAERCIRC